MNFFSKFFKHGNRQNPEDWLEKSLCIAKGLEHLRKTWYNFGVKILQEQQTNGKDSPDIKLANINLGGDADLAIKAFQLYFVSWFIAQHTYIPRKNGKDFADILYSQVCGTQIEKCMEFLSRYYEVQSDVDMQIFRFVSDVAKYITENEAPLTESMLLGSTVPNFVANIHLIVAKCFDDEGTVKEIEAQLKKDLE